MKLVSTQLKLKLGGAHTTIIGGRYGYKIINNISKHSKVKNIIPSIISYKVNSKNNKKYAKIQRPDIRGNLRLLLSFGSSYQEIRIITYLSNFDDGIKLQKELNEVIDEL